MEQENCFGKNSFSSNINYTENTTVTTTKEIHPIIKFNY